MFCALNGATRRPSWAKMRQSAVAITDLPAWEEVPCTMMTRAGVFAFMGGIVHATGMVTTWEALGYVSYGAERIVSR